MTYSLMYRGFLTSCNYRCGYCPFAKRVEAREQLARDRQSLEQFTEWIARESDERWRILFTPWGEALVRPWYRDAIARLSLLPQVESVTVQTNLSCTLDWIESCDRQRVGFWATFHPTEADAQAFVAKIRQLKSWGVRLSVGMVAVPDWLSEIEAMRACLPADVYLWLNAQQPRRRPYRAEEIARLSQVDPHFQMTLRPTRSLDRWCRAGETSFTVDGHGDMRRCHFVDEIIGNIYTPQWRQALRPRRCPKQMCHCYLGKTELQADELSPRFGGRILDDLRIPDEALNAHKLEKEK